MKEETATGPAWPAQYFEHAAPHAHAATVILEPGTMVVSGEGTPPRRWPLASVVVVRGRGKGEPVQLELRGEQTEALIVADRSFLAALEAATGGQPLRRLDGGPPVVRLLLGAGLALVLALFAAWRWGVPALAGVAADRVPPEWERKFGAAVVEGMAPAREQVTDERIVQPVGDIFGLLVDEQASRRDSFQVIVLRAKMVNAFAAPGGYVVVTTGLLGALRGPDELAAVLAHEISHVARRHTTRGLFARLGVRALFALLAGDQSGLGPLLNAAGTLGELSYSRNDETEADEGAAQLLARAGVNPASLDRALGSIAGAAGGAGRMDLAFLSTHPSTAGRREHVRKLAAGLTVSGSAALPGEAAWAEMREAVGSGPAPATPSSAPH